MILFVLFLWLVAQEPRSAPNAEVESLRGDKSCGDCHVEIYREWAGSAHARTVGDRESEALRLAYFEGNPPRGYFAPALLTVGDSGRAAVPREVFVEAGVDCIACHADADFAMHGPHGTTAPHKVVKDDRFSASEVCMPCHGQGDYLDQYTSWKTSNFAKAGITCQVCHMPGTKRRLVQHWALEDLPSRDSKRHTFVGAGDPRFLRGSVRLRMSRAEDALEVSLENVAAGHFVPGSGMRQMVILVEMVDGAGNPLVRHRETLGLEGRAERIPPGGKMTRTWPLHENASRARTRVLYKTHFELPDDRGEIMAEQSLVLQ